MTPSLSAKTIEDVGREKYLRPGNNPTREGTIPMIYQALDETPPRIFPIGSQECELTDFL